MIVWPFKGNLTGSAPAVEQFMLPFIETHRAKAVEHEMKISKPLTPQEAQALVQSAHAMDSELDPLEEIDIEISQCVLFIPVELIQRKVKLLAIRDCNILLDKWLPILEAFTRFKSGLLRSVEFDGHMLPLLTRQAHRCFASGKLYPHVLPTPDGLPIVDLWLYNHQPFLNILSDVTDSLALDQILPKEVIDYLTVKTGLVIMTTYE